MSDRLGCALLWKTVISDSIFYNFDFVGSEFDPFRDTLFVCVGQTGTLQVVNTPLTPLPMERSIKPGGQCQRIAVHVNFGQLVIS